MAIKNIYSEKEKTNRLKDPYNTAAPRTQSTPQNSVWNAEQSTPRLQGDTYQKIKREKTPSERGEEVVRAMLEDEGLLEPPKPERNEAPAARTFTTGVGRSDITGPAADAARNAAPGDGPSIGTGNVGGDTKATPAPTFEEVMMAAAPDLAAAGIDVNAMQAGFQLGNTAQQLAEDTHLAPGTSLDDYIWDKIKSGAWLGAEGARNGLVDFSEACEKGWLLTQNVEAQQQALFNDAYREQAERNNLQTKEVLDTLPEYSESFRSHKAAENAQQIDELYDAGGYFKLLGDIVSAGGQTVPMIGINAVTGGWGGLPYLFVSAEGNASTEARAGGADDDMALLYGVLSGGLEVATEKMFDGIPGMKGGWLNNWMADYAETNMGRAVLKAAKDSVGEGFEEFTSGIIQPYLAKMWNGDERDFWQTLGESAPDALYDGFLGAANGFGLSLPGNLSNIQNARIVDAALDIMDHGGTLSDAQLEMANAALQELTRSWGKDSKWSKNANQQWTDAGNGYFGSRFSQTADPAAAQGNRPNISEVFFPPIFDHPAEAQNSQANTSETAVQADAAAATDPNAASSPAADNAAAAQNDQSDLSNLIFPPIFDHPAEAQNSWANTSETAPQAGAAAAADSNAFSSPAANNAAAVQSGPFDFLGVTSFLTGNEITANQNSSKATGESTSQTNATAESILSPTASDSAMESSGLNPSNSIQHSDFASSPATDNMTLEQNGQIVQEKPSQTIDYENTDHQVSNQTNAEEQQEKTSLDDAPKKSEGTDIPKLSWKERMSVTDGKTMLQSNDGEHVYEIPSLKEIPVSKKPNGVITLLRSFAHAINSRDYRDYVKAFADKNLLTKFNSKGDVIQANPIQIKSDGTIVLITQTGINEFSKKIRGRGWKASDNVDSIMILDKLIEEGIEVDRSENKKGRINPYTYYQSKINIEGREYNVKIYIKNTAFNNLYYYHSLEKIEITPSNGTSYRETRRPGPNK